MKKYFFLAFLPLLFISCSPNNVETDKDSEAVFKENKVEGSFALLNNMNGKFSVYNIARFRDSSYSPASTFKIVNALVGLQTGLISNDSMQIAWDGIERSVPAWNKDLTMYEAFRVSSVPYYQEVARRIGKKTMQSWLDTLAYGNKQISGAVDSFWLNNTLKIKPDEQLGLIKKLYFNELPFFKLNQEMVKRAMLFEDNANYKLSYKTGTGVTDNGNKLIWLVGWIEENRHPYFFVLNVESNDSSFSSGKEGLGMLKAILAKKGFFEGKL
jgi:beta-lactamase class D